jgi:hypothetical protein
MVCWLRVPGGIYSVYSNQSTELKLQWRTIQQLMALSVTALPLKGPDKTWKARFLPEAGIWRSIRRLIID